MIADLIELSGASIADLLSWSHDLVEVFQVSSPAILQRAQESLLALEDLSRSSIAAHADGGAGDLIYTSWPARRPG